MSSDTILVADDSADIRTVITYSLLDQGFRVVEAANGYEAVRLARQCRPALVLLDLCMPGIDGWEVATRLRGDPAFENTPIIAMTAYDVRSAVQAAHNAGCQRVISKPFDLDEITHAVVAFLSAPDLAVPAYA